MLFGRIVRIAFVSSAALLAGCSQNSHFSESAVQYNREAEQVQDQVLLMNILRASYRRPLEFSGVQTVSGTASAQGQVGLSYPLAQHGSMTPFTIAPQITASGGPTVTVGVVDTQDFYEGLLKPMSTQLIDLYVQRGLPRMMLYDLFFQNIVVSQRLDVTTTDPKTHLPKTAKQNVIVGRFDNKIADETAFTRFQDLLATLVFTLNLSTDQPDKPKSFGPLLTADEIRSQTSYAARAATAGLEIKAVDWCGLSASEQRSAEIRFHNNVDIDALKKSCDALKDATGDDADVLHKKIEAALNGARIPTVLYRTQKPGTDYQMCFDLPAADSVLNVCNADTKPSAAPFGGTVTTLLSLSARSPSNNSQSLCEALQKSMPRLDCSAPIAFDFKPRSTYSIIYYLGEVVRQETHPDSYSTSGLYKAWTYPEPGTSIPLFDLSEASRDDERFLHVDYGGTTYAISDREGEANEILDLVVELVALNKSAKDLPTSSVITAVGAP